MADAFPPGPADGGEVQSASGAKPAERPGDKPADPIVIKKYANRRLYNTGSSSYVTLEHLSQMVKDGVDFVVFDAKTNEDITRQVLTQIIFEAENSGQNLLPIQFLRQLIQLYGAQMQSLVPGYLEMSLDAFTRQQEKMRDQIGGAFPAPPGLRLFEEQVRQNMAIFGQAMKMFSPFAAYPKADEPTRGASEPARAAAPEGSDDAVSELRVRMEEMQRQIERLARKS